MVDTNTETFVTDSPVKVHDARSGISVSGQLTVAFARAMGILAYAARSAEIYNFAPLGVATSESVSVKMVYSRNAALDVSVSGGAASGLVCFMVDAADEVLVVRPSRNCTKHPSARVLPIL